MKEYLPILKTSPLFHAMDETEIKDCITFLEGHIHPFPKQTIIYNFLDPIYYAGIILEGKVEASMLNFRGNTYGLRQFKTGDHFAAAYALLPAKRPPVQILTTEDSTILLLKLSRVFQPNRNKPLHQFTENLLSEIAKRNISQNMNMQLLIQNRIRDKLILFFHSMQQDASVIKLPFNRQQLADRLGVDRSALSRELSRMKKEGLIDFHKNTIHLKQKLL